MQDWWSVVFEHLSGPTECKRLGLACKSGIQCLSRMKDKILEFGSDERKLKCVLKQYGIGYECISDFDSMTKITNLFMNVSGSRAYPVEAELEHKTPVELNYFGIFYKKVLHNYRIAKEYYLGAIALDYAPAMNNMAIICHDERKLLDYKKYLLMAIERGYCLAMNYLGDDYAVRSKYPKMVKYYMMAINKGDYARIYGVAYHYLYVKKDYKEALRICLYDPSQCSKGMIEDLKLLLYLYEREVYNKEFERLKKL